LDILKKKDGRINELQDELAHMASNTSAHNRDVHTSSSHSGDVSPHPHPSTSRLNVSHEDTVMLRQELASLQQKAIDQTQQIHVRISFGSCIVYVLLYILYAI